MSDKCRSVEVDGFVIRVHGGREMNAADRDAFAEVVRAAKRRMSESVSATATPSDQDPSQKEEGLHE